MTKTVLYEGVIARGKREKEMNAQGRRGAEAVELENIAKIDIRAVGGNELVTAVKERIEIDMKEPK